MKLLNLTKFVIKHFLRMWILCVFIKLKHFWCTFIFVIFRYKKRKWERYFYEKNNNERTAAAQRDYNTRIYDDVTRISNFKSFMTFVRKPLNNVNNEYTSLCIKAVSFSIVFYASIFFTARTLHLFSTVGK